jgi:hypothetical protein
MSGTIAVMPPVSREPIQRTLACLLDELASVLLQMPPAVYTARPVPAASGSIGEHVRHILDHVAAVAAASPDRVLTYDQRNRGTAVEANPAAALQSILRCQAMLSIMSDASLDRPMAVSAVLARGDAPATSWSTLRREVGFVISHTIHHQASIATLLSLQDVDVPDAFGLAPSTPRRLRS